MPRETAISASAASRAVRSQKLDSAYPPPSCSAFHGRRGSRLWTGATCGTSEVSLVRWPPRFAYQVWLCARSTSSSDAAMARSTDIACRAARYAPRPARASQGRCPCAPSRSSPQVWTSTSVRRRSSRTRYSTWTPAPPYTSGGNSRVSRPTRTSAGPDRGAQRLALADHDDPAGRDVEPALAVGVGIDAELGARLHADVLVEDRAAHDGIAADLRPLHEDRVLDLRVGVHVCPGREHAAAHLGAGDDHPLADHRVQRVGGAALLGEHELGRRQRLGPGQDRPLAVVQVEDGVHRD